MAIAAPTFDNLVNDLTGSSVTITVTPPTDPGYVQTTALYRRMSGPNGIPVGVWTSGGTYVGVGGVTGTFQVTGLEDDQLFEFALVAEDASGYSLPSITRRVVVSDSGRPVDSRILDNLAAALNSINTADGYNFDICQVEVLRAPGQTQLDEYPGAVIYEDYETKDDRRPVGGVTNRLTVFVEGWFSAYEDLKRELELWRADLITALLQDRRRGGDAVTTKVVAARKMTSVGAVPYGGVLVELSILFRTDWGNPYQRR